MYYYRIAFETVWSSITILLCWFHLVKALKEKTSVEKVTGGLSYINEKVIPMVRDLHRYF